VEGCVADEAHQIVSTPAYMLGPGIAQVAAGIEACIGALLRWCA
jgi:enhancing lycopene biosynthesis protein 2